MSYEEEENHIIFDVRFKATNQQANDVWILLSCTKEWREHDALDSLLRYGSWHLQQVPHGGQTYEAMLLIAKRHTELRSLCSQQVRDLVRAKGLEA